MDHEAAIALANGEATDSDQDPTEDALFERFLTILEQHDQDAMDNPLGRPGFLGTEPVPESLVLAVTQVCSLFPHRVE